MPLSEYAAKHTARDTLRLIEFLRVEDREAAESEWRRHRTDWYLAQIAFMIYILQTTVRKVLGDNSARVDRKLEDFLIDFGTGPAAAAKKTPNPVTAADRRRHAEHRTALIKGHWKAMLNRSRNVTHTPPGKD